MPINVLAVHGNGGGGARFERILGRMPDDVVLHAPTLPGFGGRPLGDVDSVAGLADALRVELDALPRPRVVLGHGIGGSVALELLTRHPDLAEGLVLHAPVGTRLDTRWFPRLMSPDWVRRAVQVAISSRVLRPVWRRTIVRDVPAPFDATFLAAYGDADAFAAMFDWLTSDWFDALPATDLPSTMLWGEDDRVLGADQRSDYHRVLTAADERTVPGWGHFPMLADPDGYAAVVAEVVRDLVDRTSADAPED